jgi:sugar transferase (PEP-CTERM/EpsH1 system associated)
MTKILRIVNSMGIGGLERGVHNLTLNLEQDNFQHVFCCLHGKGHFGEELEKKGIKFYELHKKEGLGLNLIPKIRIIIKKEKPDIIHTHNTDPFQLGTLASLGLDVIRIHTDHNSFASNESKKALFLNNILSNFTDKIICVTKSVKEDLIRKAKIGSKKLTVIYNGSDLSQFNVKVKKKDSGKNTIGIVARLSREKDIFTLIKAFKLVNKKISSNLLIAGDGPLRNKLEESARGIKDIKFLGMRTDIPKLMPGFDVYVLSSLTEGNSQTIREAMACSKPVVATHAGGNPELVVHGETGFLVPKRNPEKMAEAIVKLLKDKDLREKMGKAGRKRAEKYFTIEKQAENYKRLYGKFIS